MRRILNVVLTIGLISMIVVIFSGFQEKNYEMIVYHLIGERNSILESGYFGDNSYDETELLLNNIEGNPLLSEDLNHLKFNLPTDMDKIIGFTIVDLMKIDSTNNAISFQAEISWSMKGLDSHYSVSQTYYLVLVSFGERYKLSYMVPVA